MLRSVSVLLAVVVLGCAAPTLGVQQQAEAPCLVPEDQRDTAASLYKTSRLAPGELQHVATIHGWVDDYAICHEFMMYLSKEEPGRYFCRPGSN